MSDIVEGEVKYEIIEYEGKEARFYPASGAIQDPATGKFLANRGGNPLMKSEPGYAAGLAKVKAVKVREAIIKGLSDAATSLEDVIGEAPEDMLAEIVKARAVTAASSSGKAGNDAARFIFSVIGHLDEQGKEQGAAMEIKMSPEMAKFVMDRMINDGK